MAPRLDWSALARTSRRELEALQNAALARHVREELYPFSAHYRRVFDEARVSPRDIRTVADLRRLPFTTKQDLLAAQSDAQRKRDFVLIPNPDKIRAHWPFLRKLALVLGGARARELVRHNYTPNFVTFTTGRSTDPVTFAFTPHDLDLLGETGARLLDVVSIPEHDARILNLFPFAPHLAFWQTAWAGFRTGRMVLSTGGGKVMGTSGCLRIADRLQPTVLIGTPGFVYHLLREAAERKSKLAAVRLVVLGAEKVTPGLKRKMAESLEQCGAQNVTILGTYGFTEARMAFGECPSGFDDSPGYHVYPDLGVVEIVDPKTGEPVPEGESGEIVFTPIVGHGTVVCRYRTGDIAVGGLSWQPCPWCGRTVPRVASELRRATDQRTMSLTKIKGTLVDLSHIGTVLSDVPEVEEWQVVLQKKNNDPHDLDQFLLRLSLRPGAERADSEKKIRRELLDATEVAPNDVEFHDTRAMLELLGMETEMKEKRFLDLRPK
ncbi:MAG: phenylacetate--CoA ligase family protein [Planctomycetota bacterium]